jgi:hypothetical protein
VPVDFLIHRRARCCGAAESGVSLIYVVPADYGWLGFGRNELRDLIARCNGRRRIGCALLPMKMSAKRACRPVVGQLAEEIVARISDSIMLDAWLRPHLIGSVADRSHG